MNPIAEILKDHPVLILDGALATELEARGCDLKDPLWSAKILLEAPERIVAVHADYFAAGADVAITASYQASVPGLVRRGLKPNEALALIGRSVTLAAEARDAFWQKPENRAGRPRPLVAGSVGPYGAYLADGSEYRGDYRLSEDALIDFHRPRVAALIAAGADILACETLPCLAEARVLAQLLTEFPDTWAWFSFSARDEAHICHGEPLAECAALLDAHPRVAAIGVNCTAPAFVPDLIRAARRATTRPIIVYPNSGESYDTRARTWQGRIPGTAFAELAPVWYQAGARIIGGCCRTTPQDIRALADWARGLRRCAESPVSGGFTANS